MIGILLSQQNVFLEMPALIMMKIMKLYGLIYNEAMTREGFIIFKWEK